VSFKFVATMASKLFAFKVEIFENARSYPFSLIHSHITTMDGKIQAWLRDANFSNIQIWKGSNMRIHTCVHRVPQTQSKSKLWPQSYPATTFAL